MKLTFLLSLTSIGLSLACPGPQWPAEFKDSVRDCDKCSEECRTTSRTIVDMNDFCKGLVCGEVYRHGKYNSIDYYTLATLFYFSNVLPYVLQV